MVASSQLDDTVPAELRATMFRTSFAGAALTAGAVGVVLCLSVPPRTSLQNLLDLLPVSRTSVGLGQMAPMIVVGFAFSIALSSTASVIIIRTSPSVGGSLTGIALYVLLILTVLMLSIAIFTLVQSASTRWLRTPSQYSSTLAGSLSLSLVIAATTPDILATSAVTEPVAGGWELLPSRIFAWAAAGGVPWAPSAVTAVAAATGALVWLSAKHQVSTERPVQPRLLKGLRPLRRTPWFGMIWAESLIAVRTPQFVITAVAAPTAVAGVSTLALLPMAAPLISPLGLSLVVFPLMLGIYNVGRTARTAWIEHLHAVPVPQRATAKLVAVVLTSGPVSLVAFLLLATLGHADVSNVPDTAARCVLAAALSLLVGTIVPYSDQQPLSIVTGGFALATIYMLTTLGISFTTQAATPGTSTLLIALCGFVAGVLFLIVFQKVAYAPARS